MNGHQLFSQEVTGELLVVVVLIGALVLVRIVVAVLYLPFHLAMNRRNVPIEKREAWAADVTPAIRILLFFLALCLTFWLIDG